jgi:type II secretion system protein N
MAEKNAKHPLWLKIGFGFIAFILFLWFSHMLFPYDMLKAEVGEGLSQSLGMDVTFGHVSPAFLWGFTVDGIEVKGVKIAGKVKISPNLFDLITGITGFNFKMDFISSGQGEGFLRLPPQKSKRLMEISLSLTDVDMSGLSVFFPTTAKPNGKVNGELSIITPRESFDTAVGSFSFTWNKGTMPLKFEELPFDALTFETLVLDANIDKGVLSIRKANLTGAMSGNLQGNIGLSSDIKDSRMNLTGELNLPPAMKNSLGPGLVSSQGLRFSLRGNLDMPKLHVITSLAGNMPVTMRTMPVPQNMTPPQQNAMTQQDPVNQQNTGKQTDMRRPQESGTNQPIEPEGEGHE